MTSLQNHATIAYLAPEIPALSATFVYEEMLALERRGIGIVPISVHLPAEPAIGQAALLARVCYLYQDSKAALAITGLWRLPNHDGALAALRYVLADMRACGLHRRLSWKLLFQFLVAVKLATVLKKHGCTHLHVHFAHVPTQIAMYACAMAQIPFTMMAHANDIYERGLLLPEKAQRSMKMLTISEHNRRHLVKLGVSIDKIDVVRCGVSFAAPPLKRSAQQGSRYRIGTLGRLVEKKGMDILIMALAQLREQPYAIELSIAGDGPLRSQLEALIMRLGMTAMVRFEGSMPHQSVTKWMQELDVFVLACKPDAQGDMDGIPVVLMEAMSQAVPVISTRLSGIPELVVHQHTGLLAEPGNEHDLASQIVTLLGSATLRDRLALEGQQHVEHEFGQSLNLDRLMTHLNLTSSTAAVVEKSTVPQVPHKTA